MISLKEKVYNSLLADILNGTYPLDFVFNEKFLIDKYQVSRSPVRDALIELCNEGVLYVMPRYGYKIVPISGEEVRELTQFRLLLEISAFREVCESHCEDILSQLRTYNARGQDEIERPTPDVVAMWNNNISFHLMLISWLGNAYAEEALRSALMKQLRAYSQMYWARSDHSRDRQVFNVEINRHHKLLEKCLEERDFDRAIQTLRDDICEMPAYIRSE